MNVAPTRFIFFTYSSHHWGLVPVLERQTCRWRPHRFLHCGKSEGIVQWWSSPYDQDNLLLLSIWSCNGWTSQKVAEMLSWVFEGGAGVCISNHHRQYSRRYGNYHYGTLRQEFSFFVLWLFPSYLMSKRKETKRNVRKRPFVLVEATFLCR